jgi:hypothetical protein
MALYFAADHVVWAHQIGLLTDKRAGERAQKLSLWSWALGSVTTMILEANIILAVSGLSPNLVGLVWFLLAIDLAATSSLASPPGIHCMACCKPSPPACMSMFHNCPLTHTQVPPTHPTLLDVCR